MQVPNPPGSGKDIAEGKGVYREVESEGSRMWGANVNHFFTLLGKMFFTSLSKQIFTS
ncbi:hypothetical protein Lac2_27000 [Claveliimonas bilis]|nr:hypothetical protein Lac2_27000 [Claveliimonas bilis]